jgi:hypothetical protein
VLGEDATKKNANFREMPIFLLLRFSGRKVKQERGLGDKSS